MEWLIAALYIALGLAGGASHWFKKRYIDETTQLSFIDYLKGEKKATKKALFAIFTGEIALAAASGGILSFSNIVAAVTAGYTADSVANKASDA